MLAAYLFLMSAYRVPVIQPGLRTRTPVLTFHDMVPVRDSQALWVDCTPSELRAQLDWLTKRGAHFIDLRTLYRHLTTGSRIPSHAIAITFADNYLGFYRYALPIFRKRHIPVAMFVHTDFVGSPIGRPKMNWTQLVELDRERLVTICSQTRSHPASLPALSDERLSHELVGSKKILEKRLGHEVPYLAYPNGIYDDRVARAAEDAGYAMAFTEVLKPAERSPSIFQVARYVHTKYRRAWADTNANRK